MRRECWFIKTSDGRIFVDRPTSFFTGMARHQWLKGYFGKECSVASPDWWEMLTARHGKPKLLVEEDGQFRIEEIEE